MVLFLTDFFQKFNAFIRIVEGQNIREIFKTDSFPIALAKNLKCPNPQLEDEHLKQ
jgi:hypothetical protein